MVLQSSTSKLSTCNVGNCRSKEGVQKNLEQAFEWTKKAAELGFVPTQMYVGYCYFEGQGVPENFQEAKKWLLKAAEKEFCDSYYWLGCLYHTEHDYQQAANWYQKSVDHCMRIDTVPFLLGACYHAMKDYEKGYYWLKYSAESGSVKDKEVWEIVIWTEKVLKKI